MLFHWQSVPWAFCIYISHLRGCNFFLQTKIWDEGRTGPSFLRHRCCNSRIHFGSGCNRIYVLIWTIRLLTRFKKVNKHHSWHLCSVVDFHTLLRDCSSRVVIVSWVNIVGKQMCFFISFIFIAFNIWYARTSFISFILVGALYLFNTSAIFHYTSFQTFYFTDWVLLMASILVSVCWFSVGQILNFRSIEL